MEPRNKTINSDEIDLIDLLRSLKRRIWIIVAAIAAGIIIAAGYTILFATPLYSSTAILYLVNSATTLSVSDLQIGTQLTPDYSVLVKTHPVIDTVIDNLDLNMSYSQLAGRISVSNPADSHFLNITVTDPVPETAQKIANEVASVTTDKIELVMKTERPTLAEEAQLPTSPVSPSLKKNSMLGGLAGLVLSAGFFSVLYLLNDKIHTEDDVSKYLQMTTLGVIPKRSNKKKKNGRRNDND